MSYTYEQYQDAMVRLYKEGRMDEARTIAQHLSTMSQEPEDITDSAVETLPTQPAERSVLGAIDDTAKGVTSSFTQAAADSIKGVGTALSAGVQKAAEGEVPLPSGSLLSPLGALNALQKGVTNLFGGPDEKTKAEAIKSANEIGTKIRSAAGTIASPLDYVAKDIRDSMSEKGKILSKTDQFQGNVIEVLKGNDPWSTLGFTDEATKAGVAQAVANSLGSVVFSLTVGRLTGSGLGAAAAGGLPAGQEGAQAARERIKVIPHVQLVDDSPLYASLIRDGVPQDQAREFVIQRAEESAAMIQGTIAGAGDAFTFGLLTKGTRLANRIPTRIGRYGARVGISTVEESGQELGEGLGAEFGINQYVKTPYGKDSFANLALGGLTGGLVGSVSTQTETKQKPPPGVMDNLRKVSAEALEREALEKKMAEAPAKPQDYQDLPMTDEEAMMRGEQPPTPPGPPTPPPDDGTSLPMTEEEAMTRGEPPVRKVAKITEEEAMYRGEPQAEFTKSVVDLETELTRPALQVEINGVATTVENAVAANEELPSVIPDENPTVGDLADDVQRAKVERETGSYDLETLQLHGVSDVELRKRAYKEAHDIASDKVLTENEQRRKEGKAERTPQQTKQEIKKLTNTYTGQLVRDLRKKRDSVSSLDPAFVKAEKKRLGQELYSAATQAANRERSERQAQLNKADTLDQPIDPLKSENPEPDDTTPERRKVFVKAVEKGKLNAPNRNNELSAVMDSVAASIDPSNTPAAYIHIFNKVKDAIKAIEALGIHTTVDIAPNETYLDFYVNTGEKVSNGVAFARKPNERRPNGAYVVALRYDTETQKDDGMNFRTLLHEAVHIATIGAIEAVERGLTTDKNIIKAVEELRQLKAQVFEDYVNGEVPSKKDELFMYANSNLYEFIAVASTSPTFQLHMKKMADRRNPKRSVWTSFKRAVLTSLGIIENKGEVTQYESLIGTLETIISAPINDGASAMAFLSRNVTDGFTAHEGGDINELLTPEMVLNIRNNAEAAFLRREQDPAKSPYGAFNDLSVNEPAEGYVFHGMEEAELFAGQVPQQPNGNKDAPYVFVSKQGETGFNVIVNVPNSTVHLALKRKFPGYTIMTPSQGLHYLRTGQTPITIMSNAAATANNAAVNRALGGLFNPTGRTPNTKLLAPLMDIHDVQTAIAMQKLQGTDMTTNAADFLVNGPNAQALLHNNPLLRFVRQAVHRIVHAQSVMARHHVYPMSQTWFNMSEESRELAIDIAIHQDQIQRAFTTQELHNAGVPSDVIHLLDQMKTALDVSVTEWNQYRTTLGLKPVNVRNGYFPSLFVGDYRAIVRDDQGNTVGVVTSDTELGLKQKQKKVKAKFPWANFDPFIRIGMERRNLYSDSAWDQIELISDFMSSPNASQQTKTEFGQFLQGLAADDARHILGFSRHEKHKIGAWGSMGRDPTVSSKENTHLAFQGLIMYLEDGANHHAQMLTLADLADITSDPDMRKDFPRTVKYIDDLYQHISRRKPPSGRESRQGGALHSAGRGVDAIIEGALRLMGVGPNKYRRMQSHLRAAFSSFAMGFGSIGFSIVQLMQVIQCGPMMASYLRTATGLGVTSMRSRLASAQATVAVLRLFMDFMANKFGSGPIQGLDWFGGDADTKAALKYATDNNLITINDLELAQTAMLSPLERKVDVVINFNQRATEAATRPLVYMWLYYILKDTTLSKQHQYEIARNATNFVMAEYHSTARPMIYQAIGTTGPMFGQLKTFPHSYTGQQVFWSKNALTGKTARPLIALMLAYMLYVGADDMPIYDELDLILKLSTKGLNTINPNIPVLSYKDWLAPHMPEMIKYGLISKYTDIDFQKRLRMPPLINEELFANMPALNWAGDILSANAEYVRESFRQGKSDTVLRNRAAYTMAPTSLKGPMEHWFYREPGTTNEMTKDMMGKWTHRNEFDWAVRWLGLRSLEDSIMKEQVQGTKGKIKAESDRKKEISEEYTRLMIQQGGITIEKYHELRGEYIQLGGKPDELDATVKRAQERLAKGETQTLLETKPTEKTWFFYENSRR